MAGLSELVGEVRVWCLVRSGIPGHHSRNETEAIEIRGSKKGAAQDNAKVQKKGAVGTSGNFNQEDTAGWGNLLQYKRAHEVATYYRNQKGIQEGEGSIQQERDRRQHPQ